LSDARVEVGEITHASPVVESTPLSVDQHPRAAAISHTDLHLVNVVLAALAAACVIAALAGSIVH
jgi:hypothetical protein